MKKGASILRRFAGILAIACVAAMPGVSQNRPKDLKPTVILISLDGFRYDYLDKYSPPTLNRLAKEGVRAKWMIPSFPTKTFPNHFTVATGLYPQNHGIVENNVYDFGEVFTMSKRSRGGESALVVGRTDLGDGGKAGPAGRELFLGRFRGRDRRLFPDVLAHIQRPRSEHNAGGQDLELSRPAGRPSVRRCSPFTSATTDDVGHEFGPDAEETRYGVLEVDEYIARLIAGLQKRGLEKKVNIIITSDHGMAAVDQRNAIIMDDLFDTKDKKLADPVITTGEIWQIFPKPGMEDRLIAQLKNIKNATCWRKADIPARLHYSSGKRVAPIVCSADEGWYMTDRERFERRKENDEINVVRGAHGFDNRYQSMMATFIAHGPAFKKGYMAEPFENIEVYNVMCKILGLTPAKNDGDLSRVRGMLR